MFELTPFDRRRQFFSYDPFKDFFDFDRRFFGSPMMADFKTDVRDAGDSYVLEAELPGFKKEDIHIDIDGDYLTISAERSYDNDQKNQKDNYIKRERYYGSFSRSFDLSGIKSEAISAAYKRGVLTLTMPKKDGTLPSSRRLEIE